ncbi:hypothetical protein CN03_02905 [Thalassolituus oleivorans]|jgi:hypothetical protein|uniref:hypothetical protein n=1 Tax=Thalassolituus oleivorans TaxID=187493 RepID=UPI0009493CAC|nr:hypothetical protein [Thalassolituus oleivorans]APR65965.1 hypothetical protein CN03_02905 [Thalassolituus oleivorans]
MKKRSFAIDQSLYEVINSMKGSRFTTQRLRDLFALRLEKDGIEGVSLAEIRLYVYEYIRRMEKSGWLSLDGPQKKRGQVYRLNVLPDDLKLELKQGRFHIASSNESEAIIAEPVTDKSAFVHSLNTLLKELELDMLATMGEVERYKLLIKEMPEHSSNLESYLAVAREKSSKLIGHFRAVENTLHMLQAS